MQQDYVTTAKDATSATTRLELFTKDLHAAQEEARKAIGVAAEANARLVRLVLYRHHRFSRFL